MLLFQWFYQFLSDFSMKSFPTTNSSYVFPFSIQITILCKSNSSAFFFSFFTGSIKSLPKITPYLTISLAFCLAYSLMRHSLLLNTWELLKFNSVTIFSQHSDSRTAKEDFFTLSFLLDFPRLARLLFLKFLILKWNTVIYFKAT